MVFGLILLATALAVSPLWARDMPPPREYANQQSESADAAAFDSAAEAQFVSLINHERASNGISPLTVDRRLTAAARKHSERMAQHSEVVHQLPGEPPPQTRIADEKLPFSGTSENVGDTNRGVLVAHDGFMHSPPHRATILDPKYNAVGVGVVRVGDMIYITEDFAHTLPEYSDPQAESAVEAAIAQYAKEHGMLAPTRRVELELHQMACTMGVRDKLNGEDAMELPGVHGVLAWTADDPAKLPKGIVQVLSPKVSQYALGACFAPSARHPGGVYWLVMVSY